MTDDMRALLIISPMLIVFFTIILARPSILLNLQKKIYKKMFDIDMKYTRRTERIMQMIGVVVILFTLFGAYMQFFN